MQIKQNQSKFIYGQPIFEWRPGQLVDEDDYDKDYGWDKIEDDYNDDQDDDTWIDKNFDYNEEGGYLYEHDFALDVESTEE